jgi:hypothetical protein
MTKIYPKLRWVGFWMQGMGGSDTERDIMPANFVELAAVPKRRVYLVFLCVSAASMILSGQIQLLWRQWRIGQDPGMTAGVVTHLDCPNHGHVDFIFQVESTSFEGREHFVDETPCPALRAGQRIVVYYQRAQPTNNYALVQSEDGSNGAMRAFYTGAATLGAVVFAGPLFLVLIWTLVMKLTMGMRRFFKGEGGL